jgi:hypothetical protein
MIGTDKFRLHEILDLLEPGGTCRVFLPEHRDLKRHGTRNKHVQIMCVSTNPPVFDAIEDDGVEGGAARTYQATLEAVFCYDWKYMPIGYKWDQ